MRTDDTPYARYRREEEELMKQLDERRRAAEEAAKWESFRLGMGV